MSDALKRPEPQTRRDQILDTATRIFCEKTYHGTTLQDIADAVGLLKGSLYHYISSKEQLLADIIINATNFLKEGIVRLETGSYDPVERLHQIVIEHVRFNAEFREAGTLFIVERATLSSFHMPEVTDIFQRRDTLLMNTLREGMEKGIFRQSDVRVTALAVVGLCNSILFWYRPSAKMTWEQIADCFFDVLYEGLGVRPR